MKLVVTEKVANWYKSEYDIRDATYMRFFVRYGGFGGKIPGFSLGVTIEQPENIHASIKMNEITFYIEEADAWYFEEDDLIVALNDKLNEPVFKYH